MSKINMKAYIFLAAALLSMMPYTADAQGTEINSRDHRGEVVYQNGAVIALDEVEGLVINPMSVSYPCMLVKLAEHNIIILINHFAAKVTTIDSCSLCINRIRHHAKQHCCKKNVSLHCI